MYSFKTFIIESGDTSYEFYKVAPPKKPVWADESHRYSFKDSSGAEKHVDIHNQSIHDKPGAEISFHDSHKDVNDSKYNATGESGSKAVKIFSTVKAIMKHHAKAYPNIDYYVFDASHKEPSRVKLYSRIAKHLGGTAEKQTSTTRYKVQANKIK